MILSTYTAETGYVIQIQHGQDFVSVYKHCGSLLKKEGDTVKGGEAIALVGNTGEKQPVLIFISNCGIKGVPSTLRNTLYFNKL